MELLKDKNKLSNKYVIGIMLLTFIFYILRICSTLDINISLDELGTFVSGATLGGCDWSGVIHQTRYYGYGYYWIFAPLFWITNNPFVIYAVIYVVNALLISVTSALIYKIATNELQLPNNINTVFFSILPSIVYPHLNYNYITNDPMVFATYMFTMYCLVKLVEKLENRERNKYSIWLAISCCYLLTVHEKAILVFGLVVGFVFLWRIIINEDIVSLKFFLPTIILGYGVARLSKKMVIDKFWSAIDKKSLANTSVIEGDVFWFLDDIKNLKVILDIFISNIINLGNRTYGLFYIAIVIAIIFLVEVFRGRWTIERLRTIDNSNKKCFIIFVISMMAILITMAGLGVLWGDGVSRSNLNELGRVIRAYTYCRYYIPYMGPIILVVYKYTLSIKKRTNTLVGCVTCFGFLIGYFLTQVDVYLKTQAKVIEILTLSENVDLNKFLNIACICICIIIFCCFHKKLVGIVYIFLCTVTIMCFNIPDNLSFPKLEATSYQATYKYLKSCDDEKDIYLLDELAGYQFFLNDYTVYMWENLEKGYILSHQSIESILANANYSDEQKQVLIKSQYVQLDDNEFLFIVE